MTFKDLQPNEIFSFDGYQSSYYDYKDRDTRPEYKKFDNNSAFRIEKERNSHNLGKLININPESEVYRKYYEYN